MVYSERYNTIRCWACGYKKRLLTFIADNEGFKDFKQVYSIIDYKPKVSGVDYNLSLEAKNKKVNAFTYPIGFKPLPINAKTFYGKWVLSFLKSKYGFTDSEYLNYKGFGYVEDKKSKFFGYLIIPIYVKEVLTYYIARDFINVGHRDRYKNVDTERLEGLGKSHFLYNSESLFLFDEVTINEGWSDTETIALQGGGACACLGTSLSLPQLNIIKDSPVKRLKIALDEGKEMEGLQMAKDLLPYKDVKVVNISGGDVNEIGYDKYLDFEAKENYLTDLDLMLKYG